MRTIKGSPLEYMLLGLLEYGPCSGYDLRKILTETPLRHFSDSPGAIYPALRRLAARKWVDTSAPAGSRGPQEFRLRPAGRQALVDWLLAPVTRDDVVYRSGELLLRCAFMDLARQPGAIKRFLSDYASEMAAYVEVLRRYDAEHGARMSPIGRLVFQHGLATHEASVTWARRALKTLRKGVRS